MTTIPVVVATDNKEATENIIYFLRECGGDPKPFSIFTDAYNALLEQAGNRLVVYYQLGGEEKNLGLVLLQKMERKQLHIPTIVINKNPHDLGVRNSCYQFRFVIQVIDINQLWAHVPIVQRQLEDPFNQVHPWGYSQPNNCDLACHPSKPAKVFIVHGHDHDARDRLLKILHGLSVEPVVLTNEPILGESIIESISRMVEGMDYAFVLLTGDDLCKNHADQSHIQLRARQNVILEAGYLMGVLGRQRVMFLCQNGVELPSDLNGVLYLPMESNATFLALRIKQAFEEVGIPARIRDLSY